MDLTSGDTLDRDCDRLEHSSNPINGVPIPQG